MAFPELSYKHTQALWSEDIKTEVRWGLHDAALLSNPQHGCAAHANTHNRSSTGCTTSHYKGCVPLQDFPVKGSRGDPATRRPRTAALHGHSPMLQSGITLVSTAKWMEAWGGICLSKPSRDNIQEVFSLPSVKFKGRFWDVKLGRSQWPVFGEPKP